MMKFVLIVWLGLVHTPYPTVLEFDTHEECAAAKLAIAVTHREVTVICAHVWSEITNGPITGLEAR